MVDISGEIRRFPQADPGNEPLHIGVACPTAYPVAVSSLGFQLVHLIAASHPGVITHRIALENSNGSEYPKKTFEEGLDIKSLDAIFFSVSFENDYVHLVRILDEAGIPVLRQDRKSTPVILVGGIAPTANPEPLANIADAILIGAGEVNVPAALDCLLESAPLLKGARFETGRVQLYHDLDHKVGIYVPSMWSGESGELVQLENRKVEQAYVENLDDHFSYTPVISPAGVYGAKNLIEISRGCPSHCRFCMLSYVNRNLVERSSDNIIENATRFSPDEASIGLISSRVSDHPDIENIVRTLFSNGYSVSVSSLRVATTSDGLLDALSEAGTRSVAFAPEHGSDKILKLINKDYTYSDVLGRITASFDCGITRVKLYFITGFEEEDKSDISSMIEYIESLITDSNLTGRKNNERLVVGIAPFVPKASTPFMNRAMQYEKTLKSKIKTLTQPFRKAARVEIETESPRSSILQGIFSVGGRELTWHLAQISRTRGPVLGSWDEAVGVEGDGPVRYLLEGRPAGSKHPWDIIKR